MSDRAIAPGTQHGPYRIDAILGEGGMGVVYRAVDTKLNRPVAIKILSDEIADAAARRRFQREAQLASSLNHPHILTVYDAGELDGFQYLATELVDGGTLADWLRAEPRGWRQIVDLLTGVADGLAAAHAAGMLHRDIKPANVLVTSSGYAKLADFGLAKLQDPSSAATGSFEPAHTRPGIVVGTVAYMSPEQASGRTIDARSDIFAFGIVLYEALAGRRPFEGATSLELLQTIIHQPASPLGDDIPLPLRLVVEKLLEKDPADRYQTMRELVVDLRRLGRRPTEEPAIQSMQSTARLRTLRRQASWPVVLAVGVFAALGGWLVARWLTPVGDTSNVVQVQRLTDMVGLEETPALSPDGKSVAFTAMAGRRRQIWVRLLAGGTPLAITKDDLDHYGPRWTPDSGGLIYYTPSAQPGAAGTIWEIPALGGPPQRLVNALGPGDLSHDGARIAFLRFAGGAIELATSARNGSDARSVSPMPVGTYYSLRWSPDDRRIAIVQEEGGATFASNILVVDLPNGSPRTIPGNFSSQGFAWAQDGRALIVSSAQGSMMAYPPTYNLWRVPLSGGSPVQLTFGESSYEFPDLQTQGGLVASRVRPHSDVWKLPTGSDPADNVRRGQRITNQTGLVQTVTVSPDEKEVAFLSDNGGHANVWIARVDTGEMRPVTREFDARFIVAVPLWSPRGDWINFLTNRNSPSLGVTLQLVRPDGSDPRDLRLNGAWACWSGDGEWLYFSILEQNAHVIKKVRLDGGSAVLVRDDNAVGCQTAPDGSALYYAKLLTQVTGALDFELRVAAPEGGPSKLLGQVAGTRVPTSVFNFQAYLSPDGKWLAMPLLDGTTTNLWALSTAGTEWRRLTDFGQRNVIIARRIAWSRDGQHIYASVSDVDSDIVLLAGLK
jgi:serine/threonine protein kinase/Tol biopolymer transport system component